MRKFRRRMKAGRVLLQYLAALCCMASAKIHGKPRDYKNVPPSMAKGCAPKPPMHKPHKPCQMARRKSTAKSESSCPPVQCGYVAEFATSQVLQYIDFCKSPLVFGSSPQTYTSKDCSCYTNGKDLDGVEGGLVSSRTDTAFAGDILMSNKYFVIPRHGEIQLSATFRFGSSIVDDDNFCIEDRFGGCRRGRGSRLHYSPPKVQIGQDPFYGYGELAAFDQTSGLTLGFIMTNYKVFAIYALNPQYINPYGLDTVIPFTYLVPLQQRFPSTIDTYSIVLNNGGGWASWRIGEEERLYLDYIGASIDSKFSVYNLTTLSGCPMQQLPETFQVLIGNGKLARVLQNNNGEVVGQVCQGALFNQCCDNIRDANKTLCVYPKPSTPTPLNMEPYFDGQNFQEPDLIVEMMSTYYELSVVTWTDAYDCRTMACRTDCRVLACPFQPYEPPKNITVPTCAMTFSSDEHEIGWKEPQTSTSSSQCPLKPQPQPQPQRLCCSPLKLEPRGTPFQFHSDWDRRYEFKGFKGRAF